MEGSNTHAFQLFGKKCEFLKKRGYVTPPTLEGDFVYHLYNTTLGMNVEVDKSIKGTSYQVLLGDGMKGSLTQVYLKSSIMSNDQKAVILMEIKLLSIWFFVQCYEQKKVC